MERVPPTVFEKTPVNTYELESSAVLAERLSARSLAKFSGDGT